MQIGEILGGLALCCAGAAMLRWPRKFWHLTQSWYYENPGDIKLSDGYLLANILNAIVMIIIGVVALVLGLLGVK